MTSTEVQRPLRFFQKESRVCAVCASLKSFRSVSVAKGFFIADLFRDVIAKKQKDSLYSAQLIRNAGSQLYSLASPPASSQPELISGWYPLDDKGA